MKLTLIGLGIFISIIANAADMPLLLKGGMDSGGGKGLVCFNQVGIASKVRNQNRIVFDEDLKNIASIEMLDFKYALDSFGENNIFQNNTNIYNNVLFDKLKLFPVLQTKVINLTSLIDKNIRLRNAPLEGIYDENDVAQYDNDKCVLTQLAVQQNLSNGQFIVHYDARLINHPKHSFRSQFSLKLHESIYFDLRKNHAEKNSAMTRELVAQLLRNEDNGEDAEEFIQAFIDAGFIDGAPAFKETNVGFYAEELLDARSYFLPNHLILESAFSIPYYFTLFEGSMVFELDKIQWRQRAIKFLNQNLLPSELFKKIARIESNEATSLKNEYLEVYANSIQNVEKQVDENIDYMKKMFQENMPQEDRVENKFELMLVDYKRVVLKFAELYVKDSEEIKYYNENLPAYIIMCKNLLGENIFNQMQNSSPYIFRQISLNDQIPELLSASDYNGKLKMLSFFFALEASPNSKNISDNFYDTMRMPKI